MKKIFLFLAVTFFIFHKNVKAQNVGVVAVTTPVSSCNPLDSQAVLVQVFNYSTSALSPANFPVVCLIYKNGVLFDSIQKTLFTPILLATAVYNLTFNDSVFLPAQGTYTIKCYTKLSTDVNVTNDTMLPYPIVVSDTTTVGGFVTGPGTVCSGANSGSVFLNGNVGNVLLWQSSVNGIGWTNIVNTTTSQAFSNLVSTTWYRAIVKNGLCNADTSVEVIIYVDPVSVGGSVTPDATVCMGTNGDTLQLVGYTGNVSEWQYSTVSSGGPWTSVTNTTDTLSYQNLSTTTWYRASVQSGVCPQVFSSYATITVLPISVGGTLSGDATVCAASNSGTITLSGLSGTIVHWEASTDGGSNWLVINNATTTENYTDLATTTIYRVLIQSGSCPSVYSSTVTITVDPVSNGGTMIGSATVCQGLNNDTVQITGYTGVILNWYFSIDSGANWTSIINTSNFINYVNIDTNTWYMAVVQSGMCPPDSSTIGIINVGTDVIGGTVEGSASVCNGQNEGVLTLTNFYGSIVDWELSTDDGATWTSTGNVDTTQAYSNLTVNTQYRAIVTVCNPDTSTIGTITMLPVCEVIISNLITMNGDGYNDKWFIANIDNYPESEVSIYNIYGKEVFKTKGYLNDTNDWDGTYKGKALPDGTYYYILKKDGSSDPIKGTITIVKN